MNSQPTESEDSTDPRPGQPASRMKPLRVWPPVLLIIGMVVTRVMPNVMEDGPSWLWMAGAFGPLLCGALILIWWLLVSRATWQEKLIGFIGVIVAAAVTLMLVDASMLGPAVMTVTIPIGTACFGLGAILCYRVLSYKRTAIAVVLAICGFAFSLTLRYDGLWGSFAPELHWRWQPTPEEQMISNRKVNASTSTNDVSALNFDQGLSNPQWPAFRGVDRTGRQRGSEVAADWSSDPPEQLWRVPVGPGWSSFVVAGELLYTQDQRGSMETILCLDANTGQELWTQEVESRFDDPLGGPGPRATPTLANGVLFALGAEGILMCLDPKTGEVAWQQDLRAVADRTPPMWGFCSSPLVIDSLVIVHAGGSGDKGTLAFDVHTGDLAWSAAAGDHTYCSPHPCQLFGETFVLMLTNTGINVLDPATGEDRLNYEWKYENYRAVQPQVIDADSILIPTGAGAGTRRIRIVKEGDKFSAEELWTSRHLKPSFNDFVVFQDHAYGFDGTIFACVDLATGKRKWKGGRYGSGQVLLLEDSGKLLALGEKGQVVLLDADPSKLTELSRFQALEGKTWNHPVVTGDRLYVRNAREAACYRLPLADGS